MLAVLLEKLLMRFIERVPLNCTPPVPIPDEACAKTTAAIGRNTETSASFFMRHPRGGKDTSRAFAAPPEIAAGTRSSCRGRASTQEPLDFLRDREAGGETGRFHSDQVDEAGKPAAALFADH